MVWSRYGSFAMAIAALIAACGDSSEPNGGGGGGGSGGAAPEGGGGSAPSGPRVVLPGVIALPYVVAGAGSSSLTVVIENVGDEDATGLSWTFGGDPSLTFDGGPSTIAAGEEASLSFTFEGAAAQTVASAELGLSSEADSRTISVFGVAGDPGIGEGTWSIVENPGGAPCGQGMTLSLPTAPFPHRSAGFDDPSVRIFVPDGYRDRGAQDMVVHFHGHSTTLANTLAAHRYENHVCSSGVNAVLVVPQGPVSTASGNFGKLMDPGGLAAMLEQVLVVLYREDVAFAPLLGDVALTSHSGGYVAVATNLDSAVNPVPIAQVDLFDSIYAYEGTYADYALGGGTLRSNYTPNGGTVDNNEYTRDLLEAAGSTVSTAATHASLGSGVPLVYFADTSHDGATRLEGAYGEQLRWRMRHHAAGPRVELREVAASRGVARVTWLSPTDEDTIGFRVETSTGASWSTVAQTAATESSATFPLTEGARVRVVPVVEGIESRSSDVYRVDDDASVLVVDGFDRVLDGSWGGPSHDFAAIVGEAAGGVHSASREAVADGTVALDAYDVVIWIAGDQSSADRSLRDVDRDALLAYLDGGGRVVVTGSEVGFDLAGDGFLADAFGALFSADDAGSYEVSYDGGSFGYSGESAPYEEDYPDAFAATGEGEVVFTYGTGAAAAVGIPGRTVIVGFPLELVDEDGARSAALAALLDFVGRS